jgi:hypothetical protein
MKISKGFCSDGYAVGIDYSDGSDKSVVAIVKLGKEGKPDELITTLTWEEARLVARAVAEAETGGTD